MKIADNYFRLGTENAFVILSKAKKLASKYEEHLLLLEIIRWEKKIAYALTDIKFLDEELENLEKEERYHLAQYQLRTRYRNTFFKLLTNIRKQAPGTGQAKHLDQLITSIKRLVLPKETGHNTKVIFLLSSLIHQTISFQ